MKQKFIATLLALAFALSGCSDPKNKVIPSDISKLDTDLKPAVEKLSEEDKKLFAGYVMRAKMGKDFGGKGVAEGTTIGQGIEQQKKWVQEQEAKEAEQRALKEKVEKERAELKQKINSAVTVSVADLHKHFIMLAIENKSPKDVAGVKGTIKFTDIFDKEVGSISFGYDDGIKAGSTASWAGWHPDKQFLANLRPGKYKTIFEPEAIVYADSTKLIMPE